MYKYKQEKYKRDRECAKHSIAASVIAAAKLATSTSTAMPATTAAKFSLPPSSVAETIFSSPESLVVMVNDCAPHQTSFISALSKQEHTSLHSQSRNNSNCGAGGISGSRDRHGTSLLRKIIAEKTNDSENNAGSGGSGTSTETQKTETNKEDWDALTSDFWKAHKEHDRRGTLPHCFTFADQYRQYGPLALSIRAMTNADAIKAREDSIATGHHRSALGTPSTPRTTAPLVLSKPLSLLSCGTYMSDSSDEEDSQIDWR